MGDLDFSISIDALDMLKDLKDVDIRREEVEDKARKTISFIDRESIKAYRKALRLARGTWQITEAVVRAMGGTISTQFRAIIQAGFGMVSTMIPILMAAKATGLASLNPYQVAMALLGMVEVAVALGQLGLAEQRIPGVEAAGREALSMLNSIQMMFGGLHFL